MSNFDKKLRRSDHYVESKPAHTYIEAEKPPQERTEPLAITIDPTLWDTPEGRHKLLQTFGLLGAIFRENQEKK